MWDFIDSGFRVLMIPDANYFLTQNNNLRSALENKLEVSKYTNVITTLKSVSGRVPENITVNLYGQTLTIVDWQYIERCLPTFHFLVRGLAFIYLCWYNYNQVIYLIRGSHPLTSGSASGSSSVNNTNNTSDNSEGKK